MAYLTGTASDWQTSFEKPISSQCPEYTGVEVAHSQRTSVMLWTLFQTKCPCESSILAREAINASSYRFFPFLFSTSCRFQPKNFSSSTPPPMFSSAILINRLLIVGQLHLIAFRQVENSRGYFWLWFDIFQRKRLLSYPGDGLVSDSCAPKTFCVLVVYC